jgi:hypothetical protein
VTEPSFTLVVETSDGVFLRTVQPATLLPEGLLPGPAAEDTTRNAAAYWGLPDFVFRSAQLSRGSVTREVGDAIVVVGAVGASVQVKSRPAPTSNETRERSWLDKKIGEAARQAQGTIRKPHVGHGRNAHERTSLCPAVTTGPLDLDDSLTMLMQEHGKSGSVTSGSLHRPPGPVGGQARADAQLGGAHHESSRNGLRLLASSDQTACAVNPIQSAHTRPSLRRTAQRARYHPARLILSTRQSFWRIPRYRGKSCEAPADKQA